MLSSKTHLDISVVMFHLQTNIIKYNIKYFLSEQGT